MFAFLKNNAEVIIAFFALLTAVTAVFQTRQTLEVQRIHNAKSLLPIAAVNRVNRQDQLGVTLENRGVGPLIIERVRVYPSHKPDEVKSNVYEHMPQLTQNMSWSTIKLGLEGAVLHPNASFWLVLLQPSQGSPSAFEANAKEVRRNLSGLQIDITYRDVYDNIFEKAVKLRPFENIAQTLNDDVEQ